MAEPRPTPIRQAAQGVASQVGASLRATQLRKPAGALLVEAVYSDDADALQALLDGGLHPDLPLPGKPYSCLMVACGRDRLDLVDLLIGRGADVNFLAPRWGTPLTFALSSPLKRAVPRLLEAGADPNLAAPGVSTPLHFSLHEGGGDLRRLLAAGASPEARDSEGWPALRVALDLDREELATELVRSGARPDAPCPDGWNPLLTALHCMQEELALAMLGAPDLAPAAFLAPDGTGALDLAAAGGLERVARRLLDLGLPVDGCRPEGGVPVFRAMVFGQSDLVALLLARGASLAETADPQLDPMLAAACYGFTEVLEGGQRQGRSLEDPRLQESAGAGGSLATLGWLESRGLRIGSSAPIAAARHGHPEALRWLLTRGDFQAQTLLEPALSGETEAGDRIPVDRRLATLDVLLEAGASLAEAARTDPRLAERCLDSARAEVVSGLLARGLPLPEGERPLLRAARRGDLELARLLLDGGADPDTQDATGWTALMHAVNGGNAALVQLLLKRGARRTPRNKDGQTAAMLAKRLHRKDLQRLLG
jgi:ankyrin repeat protein